MASVRRDVIRAASVNPAQIMKQAGKGMIVPGWDADLIIGGQELP